MLAARYRNIVAGVVPGSVSVLLTYHLGALFHPDPNLVMRALKAAGIALIVPGILAAMVAGSVHSFHLYIAAVVNFLFWFCFGWLVALFVKKLIELRQAIAAVRVK